MRPNRFATIALLATTLAGCSNLRRGGPEVGREPVRKTVMVENWTSTDLRVFAFYGGDLTMLGTVRALNSSLLRLPATSLGPVRFAAFMPGATASDPQYVSDQIHIFEGQQIGWQIRSSGGSTITFGTPQ